MKINYLVLYLLTLGAVIVLDGLWLGLAAKKLYATQLKGLMSTSPKWGAAALFYLLFVGFLIYFVIGPAIQQHSLSTALQRGALFGLATYATYDLTNYATLKDWPLTIVGVDMAWGAFLSAVVSAIAYNLYTKLF